jgi:hypothetical protein
MSRQAVLMLQIATHVAVLRSSRKSGASYERLFANGIGRPETQTLFTPVIFST